MKVPIYYTFKGFKENYQAYLEKWQSVYIDGEEIDFLNALDVKYSKYLSFSHLGNFTGKTKDITMRVRINANILPSNYNDWRNDGFYEDAYGFCYQDLHIKDVIEEINERLKKTEWRGGEKTAETSDELADILEELGILDDEREAFNQSGRGYIIYKGFVKKICDFWKFTDKFLLGYELIFDEVKYGNFKLAVPKIYKFIHERINQINSGNISATPQPTAPHPTEQTPTIADMPPLSLSQKQGVGLFIRSGFVKYLRQNNPNISTNQIAGFIDILTAEHLKRASINPYLSKENTKYAIQNKYDENDLDLILKKFGIAPQSE